MVNIFVCLTFVCVFIKYLMCILTSCNSSCIYKIADHKNSCFDTCQHFGNQLQVEYQKSFNQDVKKLIELIILNQQKNMDKNLIYWLSRGIILLLLFCLSSSIICLTAISDDNSKSNGEKIKESWPIHKSRNISLYIRPFDDTTIIEPIKQCNSSRTYLNIIVISAIKHEEKRLAIRQTWGSQNKINKKNIVINFLVGQIDDNYLTKKIREEADQYGDIIQESFQDSYYNLTIKSGMMLKWFIKRCPGTKYLMKCDDDMYVNIENLLKSISGNEKRGTNFLLGQSGSSYIIRDPQSKWYMPEYIFDRYSYPPFIAGPSYVMTRQVAKKIYNESLLINFFHLEDVFFTGICAGKANVTLVNDDNFQCEDYSRKMITMHDFNVTQIIQMWNNQTKQQ